MRSWGVLGLVAALGVGGVGLSPGQARACSPALPVPVPTSPGLARFDQTPPQIVDVGIDVRRGWNSRSDSCTDIGWVYLDVVAEDDQTPGENFRYRLQEWGGGEWYWRYDEPVPWMTVTWTDADPEEPLNLRYRVFVLDEAGNESAPFEVTYSEGGDDVGCSLAPSTRAAAPTWGWLLVALVAGVRRRRR
jgi:MYXO-CTERM domain-containing protein